MLVLTRRECEKIEIGDDITLHVVRVRGNRVRLGIEAPANVPVNRLELQQRLVAVSAPCPPHAECTGRES